MAEIYRNSTSKSVTFDSADVLPTAVTFTRGTAPVIAGVIATGGTALVPYEITRLAGPFDVTWSFTIGIINYTHVDTYTVISPLFSQTALVEADPSLASLTPAQAISLERTVRNVIESICNQSFSYEYDIVEIKGTGTSSIRLPKRLVSANSLSIIENAQLPGSYIIEDDGWILKADMINSWTDSLNPLYSAPPVVNPYGKRPVFKQGVPLYLAGFFGYRNVPDEIIQAAIILAVDYGADESVWRNRYVKSVSFGQETVEFNGGAGYGTGNVIVDQLIQDYTLSTMSVI